jgi:sorting nexin-8
MIAARDWFVRHDRQSIDQVDKLRRRVEQNSAKLETTRSVQKEGWQAEADRFAVLIERDQISISAALARRIFIRYWWVLAIDSFIFCLFEYLCSMWSEMRVVLHNRENALLSQAMQAFAKEESAFTEEVLRVWESMTESVVAMPME